MVVSDEDPSNSWVKLNMQLENWSYTNFELQLRVDTPLYVVKRKLVERHGRMTELSLLLLVHGVSTQVTNDKLTLHELGIDGKPWGGDLPAVICRYDFKPAGVDEPLLLAHYDAPKART